MLNAVLTGSCSQRIFCKTVCYKIERHRYWLVQRPFAVLVQKKIKINVVICTKFCLLPIKTGHFDMWNYCFYVIIYRTYRHRLWPTPNTHCRLFVLMCGALQWVDIVFVPIAVAKTLRHRQRHIAQMLVVSCCHTILILTAFLVRHYRKAMGALQVKW